MTKEDIESFKPVGTCWKVSEDLSTVCILEEGHSGLCGDSALYPSYCEVCEGLASNCNATPLECANDCYIHSKLDY
jgi:hypothetical protein